MKQAISKDFKQKGMSILATSMW